MNVMMIAYLNVILPKYLQRMLHWWSFGNELTAKIAKVIQDASSVLNIDVLFTESNQNMTVKSWRDVFRDL